MFSFKQWVRVCVAVLLSGAMLGGIVAGEQPSPQPQYSETSRSHADIEQQQQPQQHHHHHQHHQPHYQQPNSGNGTTAAAAAAPSAVPHRWMRTEQMDANGQYVLDWRVHGREIYFRITANTRGFVGLGFSLKSGRMADADLVMAWVDDRTGKPTVLVSVCC